MLRSDLCDISDAYIIVKGTITVTNPNDAKSNKAVTFKGMMKIKLVKMKLKLFH